MGRKVIKTKILVKGLNMGGIAALSNEYKNTLFQTMVGVRDKKYRNVVAVLSGASVGDIS